MTIGKRIELVRSQRRMTQVDLAKKVGVATQTIFKYENEIITNIPLTKIELIADALGVSASYLMGWESENKTLDTSLEKFSNIFPIKKQRIPLLGTVACGEPIFADEDRESYVEIGTDIRADFCLKCKGDSMIGARIHDGDIVFVRKQPSVDNGEIAVVIIEDEATLKRVFYYPEKAKLVLQAENPKYEPFVYGGEELNDIRIIGKAIAFQSDIH